MCAPKAPAPPDPTKTAQAQTQQSIDTAIANNTMGMVNQRTPDGSLSYNIIGYYTDPSTGRQVPRYEAVTELSADAQALRDASNRGNLTLANLGADQAARAGDLLSRPMDMSSLPQRADRSGEQPVQYGSDLEAPQYSTQGTALPQYSQGAAIPGASQATALPGMSDRATLPDFTNIDSSAGLRTGYETDFSSDRKRVEDALFARLDPQLARSREDAERNLANRGIKLGSDEYDRTMRNLGQTENDARLATILSAGQEQSRLAGLTRDEATFGNQAKQQEYANRTGATEYGNQIGAQRYAMDEAARQYGDDRAIQLFGLGEDLRRYGDDQALTRYGLGEDRARYDDALAAQNYGLSEEQRRYGDTLRGQEFADRQAIQGRRDTLGTQQFNQRQAILDALDRSRAGALEETMAVRSAPINEISALLSGSQVATPNFSMAQPAQMATTDIAGLINQNYAQQQQNYQAKLAQQQAAMGGLFGLGSTLIGPGGWLGKAA